MTRQHLDHYRRTQLFSMSQAELVVMLYQGAIRFLRDAIDLVAAERFDQSWQKFDRARRIVVHLCGTLNPEAGELSEKLASLYAFVIEQISVANARRDVQVAESCIGILTTLKEGWEGIATQEETRQTDRVAMELPTAAPAPEAGSVSFRA